MRIHIVLKAKVHDYVKSSEKTHQSCGFLDIFETIFIDHWFSIILTVNSNIAWATNRIKNKPTEQIEPTNIRQKILTGP